MFFFMKPEKGIEQAASEWNPEPTFNIFFNILDEELEDMIIKWHTIMWIS